MRVLSSLLFCGVFLGSALAQSDPAEATPPEEEEHVELFTTPTTKLAAAASDFGYNLFRSLCAQETGNVLLSPLSVSAALTQLSMGGTPYSQRDLTRALRYHTLQDPALHTTLRSLLSSSTATGKGLSTAARLYLSRRLRLKQEYFTLVEQTYGTRPKALQGGSKDQKEINDWVSQQTSGKVLRILTSNLPRNPGVTAVTAAYFKGKWVTRFGSTGSMSQFQVDGSTSVQVPMMRQDNYPIKMGIDSDLSCTIAELPMQDGVSLFLFLPDTVTSNLTAIEDALTAEFVQDLSMTMLPAHVSLSMPSLKGAYSKNLMSLLPNLGLTDWLADTGLDQISVQPVKLNAVFHKVVLESAPEGLQYAPDPAHASALTYHVNRPFLFLLRDQSTGALLFTGRVTNPKLLQL
ncbi:pigment epithelium-derived factor [Boleophthalmus pectinirostris]|uniref:pigment epithelium-derived factor n=1 Tax=Boleophthalmus pectinirostris TaxID=150288 RepID=UPI000A1C5F81|nr:pigment epithelium-derived factor [Boleophthalmus pectinirostris]